MTSLATLLRRIMKLQAQLSALEAENASLRAELEARLDQPDFASMSKEELLDYFGHRTTPRKAA